MTTSRRPGSILVTGAARGIGRATAELFPAHGWRVGMYDVDPAAIADAAAGHRHAVHGTLDVRDPEQWRTVLRDFCDDGALDALVNNAGVLASGPFAGMDPAAHQRMVDVNVTGVCLGAATGHEYLRPSRRGLLLNLCSAAALYGQPALATYGATKAAVKSLTEALDLEWRADGIRVRTLLPTFVATDMVTRDQQGSAGVARLGVRLSAEDVAAAAWRAVHERRIPLRGPHRPVGRQAQLMAAAAAVTPGWASRLVVGRISG